MNRFAFCAFAIVLVQISITETGLIKDVVNTFSGAKKNQKPAQNYSPDPNYKNTTWFIENEDYLTPNTNTSTQFGQQRPNGSNHNSGGFSNRPNTNTSSESSHHRPSGSHHNSGFSNRPNTDTSSESSHHKPSGSHHNSGFSNRPNTDTSSESSHHRPSGSHHNSGFSNRPNTDTSSESSHHKPNGSHHNSGFSNRPNTDTSSESSHHRPNGSHHNSGFSNRPPNYGNFPSSSSFSSNNYERPYENQKDWTGNQLRAGELIQDHSKREATSKADKFGKPVPFIPEETPVLEHLSNTQTRLDGKFEDSDDGNNIILTSDNSITCCYNNIKDQNIENRSLRCNETDCVLEKVSEKSSLWICKNIKCNVANVDFTKKVDNKKLIECAMDARNIINVQDKPISCGPNEREHNGRCRKVFGA